MQTWSTLNVSERRTHPPAVGVSTVAFALHNPQGGQAELTVSAADSTAQPDGLWVPLVRRVRAPFAGQWALPGGPLPWNLTLDATARETLVAACGVQPHHLEQLYAFGSVERSAQAPRQVTIAYWAPYSAEDFATQRLPEDPNVRWFPVNALRELAFDHAHIIDTALHRLRERTEQLTAAHLFLGEEFTLAQLRHVHEVVLERQLDTANFRRAVLNSRTVEETGRTLHQGKQRPAKLYRPKRSSL